MQLLSSESKLILEEIEVENRCELTIINYMLKVSVVPIVLGSFINSTGKMVAFTILIFDIIFDNEVLDTLEVD